MLVMGGCNADGEMAATLELYNVSTGLWETAGDMASARNWLKTCQLGGSIYAIGGMTGADTTKQVDKYVIATGEWQSVAKLQTARSGHGVCTVGNHIYVVGGFDDKALKTVECFNSFSGSWTFVASMKKGRSSIALCEHGNSIFAIGGENSAGAALDVVEMLDVAANKWLKQPPMVSSASVLVTFICAFFCLVLQVVRVFL
jgi:N-acetylneuraminic acid mutarotase